MSKQLDVYLHDALSGQLEQDKNGRVSFSYDPVAGGGDDDRSHLTNPTQPCLFGVVSGI